MDKGRASCDEKPKEERQSEPHVTKITFVNGRWMIKEHFGEGGGFIWSGCI